MKIGSKIKELRENKNISQRELADSISMNQSQYSKIERDIVDPRISTIEKISKALNINLSDLFFSYQATNNDDNLKENIRLLEKLSNEEKKSIFDLVKKLVAKK
ncbi:helix-turn-helix domain-containing protein [Aquimarina sp. MAR_2010_214]|uniref:helix-turn-helix domain-containing protein n=1 Tax=Aquimarina sp. MAR_2010_214 TaxID=1250026 RepID=UPI000C70F0FE|nr:helix-turn-helix transcriptional regulator [Aquimarina sp. MAR_2010_214]